MPTQGQYTVGATHVININSEKLRGYRSFVRNVVVQIPKFDAKPNPNPSPNPMPIRFGQMTLQTSELLPSCVNNTVYLFVCLLGV